MVVHQQYGTVGQPLCRTYAAQPLLSNPFLFPSLPFQIPSSKCIYVLDFGMRSRNHNFCDLFLCGNGVFWRTFSTVLTCPTPACIHAILPHRYDDSTINIVVVITIIFVIIITQVAAAEAESVEFNLNLQCCYVTEACL